MDRKTVAIPPRRCAWLLEVVEVVYAGSGYSLFEVTRVDSVGSSLMSIPPGAVGVSWSSSSESCRELSASMERRIAANVARSRARGSQDEETTFGSLSSFANFYSPGSVSDLGGLSNVGSYGSMDSLLGELKVIIR